MSVADSVMEGMWASEAPTISREQMLEWMTSLGIDVNRAMKAEIVFRSGRLEDSAQQEVFLKIKQHHYAEGKAWVDATGTIATETIFVPVTHLGVQP